MGIPLASLRLPQPCAFSRGWTPALAAKLRSGGSGLAFEESDLGWLSAHRNVDWFRAGDADSPSAYAAVGRGIDLQGYVHEWGGEPAALHALLARVKQIYPEAILLGGPEALAQAGFAPGGGPRDFLCMARILDPARIFSARHGIQLEAKLTDGAWSLRGPGFGLNGLSPSELSRLFFGPLGPEESEAAAPLFPIPLWVWGLDAV